VNDVAWMWRSQRVRTCWRRVMVVLCVVATGCGDAGGPASSSVSTATASISIRLSKVASSLITRVEAVVTGTDMSDLRRDLLKQDELYSGVFAVPAGPSRAFTLNGYNADGTLTYTGTTTADVIVDARIQIEIIMRRIAPSTGDIEITGTLDLTP
jgi:hypothetical protein